MVLTIALNLNSFKSSSNSQSVNRIESSLDGRYSIRTDPTRPHLCACNLNQIALSIMCSYWTCQTIQTAISQVLFSGCPVSVKQNILWQQNNCSTPSKGFWMMFFLSYFIDWGSQILKAPPTHYQLTLINCQQFVLFLGIIETNGWCNLLTANSARCPFIRKVVTNGESRQLLSL